MTKALCARLVSSNAAKKVGSALSKAVHTLPAIQKREGNGIKTGLEVLTSLPVSLPGYFPDLPGLRVLLKSVSLFPFLFPDTSRIFPDCGFSKETVSGPFLLPVSLPGNFPDLPGLRPFAIPTKK